MPRPTIADLTTTILALCAVVITGLVVRRELMPPRADAAPTTREVSKWEQFAHGGNRRGSNDADVTIVEFADFQCPYCRQSARSISEIMDSLPGRVAHVYRHYPLTTAHPHAMEAAVAAECAASQGHFDKYHDALFASQDSIGGRSWVAFALEAGIRDTSVFSRCLTDSSVVMKRIRADMNAAADLGVSGTPTLLINNRLIAGALTSEQLRTVVNEAMHHRRLAVFH